MTTDLTEFVRPAAGVTRVSSMASGIVGSEILKIAADIRAMVQKGQKICNFTVGDFDPREFPIPDALQKGIVEAYEAHETNYPPSNGMPELRSAVQRFYARELGLEVPIESMLDLRRRAARHLRRVSHARRSRRRGRVPRCRAGTTTTTCR